MTAKEVVRFEVEDPVSGYKTFVPVGIATGSKDGPALTIIGGVHGTEYAAQQATAEFWAQLDPEDLHGQVRVVLCADIAALEGHSAYVNPVDGRNLNRVWPGDAEGTLTERIAHRISSEVVAGSDAVIDVHGGEWDEDIGCFIITLRSGNSDLDVATLDLAMALGFTFVEVTEGGTAIDRGTASGHAFNVGIPSLTLEAGGKGLTERRYVDAHKNALENALRHLGLRHAEPVRWGAEPVQLSHGIMLRTAHGGLYEPEVSAGQWIRQGEVFSRVRGHDGSILEEILAPESGTVLDVIVARGIKRDGFAGKIGVL